ncbi:response regulator [Sandaracinus amylolyticus]|uniref:Response regulatory domain-containing protein n=1 Tax=Sandaracinus amylolyticus TaxID=927083 RepID=A0A0F6SDX8_9BACT|nr:response regulator [Sandaracinus amylolyticus]AKF04219.1 hypothetical protein DB32_001368 [Sandaracinus amylolyticus]
MSVLIVDACERTRARLRDLLSLQVGDGARVHEASSLDDAERVLAGAPVRVVIVDVDTPAQDGLALLASLRALGAQRLLMVLTNDASEPRRRACLARGADLFFDKSHEFERAIDLAIQRATTEPT